MKNDNLHPAWLRTVIQISFVVFSILLGLEFRTFVLSLGNITIKSVVLRPPAVEAYLPISSLMSLTYLVKTGIANRIHPAGLVIFSTSLILAILVRRGFCSWVCPIGTASQWAYRIGARLFGQNTTMPNWLDIIFRSLKYLLLGFFLYSILRMPAEALQQFIYGPYNRIADVKMYLFFRNISITSLVVITVFGLLSVIFKNFFCRYLCPYGAMLGLLSIFSPVAIRRNEHKCISCGRCTLACPNQIPVDKKKIVRSVECTACFNCVEACNSDEAIGMYLPGKKTKISALAYGVIIVGAFLFFAQAAQAFGYWQSETSGAMYKALYNRISEINHP